MAGLYIHIPFCRQACHYCNFHFSTTLNLQQNVVDAMCMEMKQRADEAGGKTLDSVYLGGGTPSLLTEAQLKQLFDSVKRVWGIESNAEITLEANPDDLTAPKLQELKRAGVNRLSIGIQSFRQQDLELMNRAHNAEEAKHCVQLAHEAGFENITIDLIYGTPGMDDEAWRQNLQEALLLNVPHISSYCLTVEPKTALQHMVDKGLTPDVDEDQAEKQFHILRETLEANGYEHYEISNFAKPGHRAAHNTSYWQGVPYIGIGPAAHSFNGHLRRWNVANNIKYIKALESAAEYFETEILSPADQVNELLMTGMRTCFGVGIQRIEEIAGKQAVESILEDAQPYLESGVLVQENGVLYLSKQHRFIADSIISDLFLVEEEK